MWDSCISGLLCLCCVEILKNLPVHSFNALIIPILRDCLPNYWWVSFAPDFQCCYFCESSCLFYLSFNFDFYVSKIMHL